MKYEQNIVNIFHLKFQISKFPWQALDKTKKILVKKIL